MRIPYTGPLPPPIIVPRHANTPTGAISALTNFLSAASSPRRSPPPGTHAHTVLLTGAGVSTASGLADYRGTAGTYTLNKTYRPIYYNEFISNHEARKRYWARSFLGWTNLHRARPNDAHLAIKQLGRQGLVSKVITQSALDSEHPEERRKKGLRTNPDGDVDVPGAPYTTFRYPACPTCLASPPTLSDGSRSIVELDANGAWSPRSTAGVLKPAVVMFGESIAADVKIAAEEAVDNASKILVIGSSLATYSAWRLVKRAKERSMPIGVLNLGGVRGEESFYAETKIENDGSLGVRCSESVDKILPLVVRNLELAAATV
ncbi:MAG: hypothetical protein LQ352_000461 [Teloschistes flavicans]|nr:MAG: hypothetical protein LQ352_000461 [Teloschistes flavicans]